MLHPWHVYFMKYFWKFIMSWEFEMLQMLFSYPFARRKRRLRINCKKVFDAFRAAQFMDEEATRKREPIQQVRSCLIDCDSSWIWSMATVSIIWPWILILRRKTRRNGQIRHRNFESSKITSEILSRHRNRARKRISYQKRS